MNGGLLIDAGGPSKLAIFSAFSGNFFPLSPFPLVPAVFSTFGMKYLC